MNLVPLPVPVPVHRCRYRYSYIQQRKMRGDLAFYREDVTFSQSSDPFERSTPTAPRKAH